MTHAEVRLGEMEDEIKQLRQLLIEAVDTIHAALAQEGISDDRRNYRRDLEIRIRSIL